MQEGETWHLVEARNDDGTPTLFRIREMEPRPELPKIFVLELPFRSTEMSELPNATQYRRLDALRDEWMLPACTDLGWMFVAQKIEDGSFFLYLYGGGNPDELVTRFSPFDPDLAFYDDVDPTWAEYAFLRGLVEKANQLPKPPEPKKPAAKKQPAPKKKPAPKTKPTPKKKPAPKKPPKKKPKKKR